MFRETLDFIYSDCSKRVAKRIEEKGITYEEIYWRDPKQISWIKNNKRTKNNKYLICEVVFEGNKDDEKLSKEDKIGLINKLQFLNRQEILWGSLSERFENTKFIFKAIISDLLVHEKYCDEIDEILCDYIPYSKYSSYRNILLDVYNRHLAIEYGVLEVDVFSNIDISRKKAIDFLYFKCINDFEGIYLFYTETTKSFNKLDKKFEVDFISKEFMSMIRKHKPDDSSLGLRVKKIIYSDLTSVPILINSVYKSGDYTYELMRSLNKASSSYIVQLEDIQKEYIENFDF